MNTIHWEYRDGRPTLAGLVKIVIAVLAGMILGLALTIQTLEFNRAGITVGAWRSTPRNGGGDVDPYALATNARDGLLPLGDAEGLSFIARADDTGAPFETRCDYIVRGPMPTARDWTLSLFDARGFPVANAANRFGFTSAEVLRYGEDAATILVSAEAGSGNWLPTGRASGYVLMLRLYDTSLSAGRAAFANVKMPTITRSGCR